MKQKINKFIAAFMLGLSLILTINLHAQTPIQPYATALICQDTKTQFAINYSTTGCWIGSQTGSGTCVPHTNSNGTFDITISGQLTVEIVAYNLFQGQVSVFVSSYGVFISGPPLVCPVSLPTYTNVGQSNLGTFSWSFPPFMSNPPGYNPTKPQHPTDNSNGTGNIVLTATNGVCPVGNASNICVFPVISGPPPQPAPVRYIQEVNQCYFNPYVATIPSATDYQWSTDNFANIADDGVSPRSALEYFGTTHVVMYVHALNGCGISPIRMTSSTTPPKPPLCMYRINEATGIAEPKEINEVNLYPNPACALFKLDLPGTDNKVEVRILTMEGALVRSFTTSESTLEVGTEGMPSGLYIIQLNSESYHLVKKIQILK
jgi:hypothetical protein